MGNLADFEQAFIVTHGTLGSAGFSPASGFGYELAAAAGGNEIGLFILGRSKQAQGSYGLNAGELSLG